MNVELLNGNALEVLPNIGKKFDYMFTSPPYNRKRNDKYNFYDDKVDWYNLIKKTIDWGIENTEYVFMNIQKNYYNKQEVFKLMGEYSEQLVEVIVWEKSNPMPASGNSITNAYEFILVLNKEGKAIKSTHSYTKITTLHLYTQTILIKKYTELLCTKN